MRTKLRRRATGSVGVAQRFNKYEQETLRLHRLLNTVNDGIHVLDATGMLVEANQAFLKMLGLKPSAIGSLHVSDWDVRGKAISKADLQSLRVMPSGKVFEAQHKHSDGDPVTKSAAWTARIAKVIRPIAWLSTPKEGWENSNFRTRFMQAGLRAAGWPVIFFGAKTFFSLAMPGTLLLMSSVTAVAASPTRAVMILLPLATIGYFLPNLVLATLMHRRRREIREALPDAIDLMAVCVEAGLGLDAAMLRTGEEMSLRSEALAEELNLVGLERRVGSTREAALRNMILRTGVEEVATFVTIVLQTDLFGTNVADSLKILSETVRDQRNTRAEEAAAKIPLKLLFPLIFFMFPSLFLVLLGPALIGVFRVLLPSLGGGQ